MERGTGSHVCSARAQPWWPCGQIVCSVLRNNPGNRALTLHGPDRKTEGQRGTEETTAKSRRQPTRSCYQPKEEFQERKRGQALIN
ncbi:hypothetical protein LEMLEM_LOCUS11051 [Lemmus lemmus]